MILVLFACTVEGGPGELQSTDYGWVLPFGGPNTDDGWGIHRLQSGELLVATHQGAPRPLPDLYLYRLSAEGEVIWESHSGDQDAELARVITEHDGVIYLGGHVYDGRNTDSANALVMAVDLETGIPLWSWVRDVEGGYEEIDGIVVEDGSVFVSGWATTAATGQDVLLARLGLDGTEKWLTTWGSPGWDEANGHLVSDGEALYLGGLTEGAAWMNGGDPLVASFQKSDGALRWQTRLAEDVALWDDVLGLSLFDGALYGVGARTGSGFNLMLWKLDTEGNLAWERELLEQGAQLGRAITAGPEQIFVAYNTDAQGEGGTDMRVLRIDPADGSEEEVALIGGPQDEEVHDLTVTADRLYLVGQTSSIGAGEEDAVVLQLDPTSTYRGPF